MPAHEAWKVTGTMTEGVVHWNATLESRFTFPHALRHPETDVDVVEFEPVNSPADA